MKIAPKKPEMKQAAVAEPPIPLMHVKREIKVESGDLIKFEMKVHPNYVNSTLKYTRQLPIWIQTVLQNRPFFGCGILNRP